MKFRKVQEDLAEADLTPMIDMVFQLIAFFMVIVNFTEAEQDDRIQLPSSQLAKPPDVPFEEQITLQLTQDERVIYAGDRIPLAQVRTILLREKNLLEVNAKTAADATIIIRADGRAETGKVQELIKECQDVGFEKFALRAMQQDSPSS